MNIANPYYFSNFITNYAQFYVRIDAQENKEKYKMKKENRKLAQEKRAQERQKQQTKYLPINFSYFLPSRAFALPHENISFPLLRILPLPPYLPIYLLLCLYFSVLPKSH